MREAFVLRLGPATRTSEREFEGWIEEVETGRELRFRSTVELLTFLAECAEARGNRDSQKSSDANAGTSSFRKETKS